MKKTAIRERTVMVRLDPAFHRELKTAAARLQMSMKELVTKAVRQYLAS